MELNLSSEQSEKLKKYDLLNLSKEVRKRNTTSTKYIYNIHLQELVDKLLIADAHNNQLRNIIKKQKQHSTVTGKSKRKAFDFTRYHISYTLIIHKK